MRLIKVKYNMNSFNFNSQICTSREQSEKLLSIGLKKETADMCWTKMAAIRGTFYVPELAPINMVSWRHTPAWSLHRLIKMIPKCVRTYSSEDDSSSLHPYVPKFDYLGVTIENIDEILVEFYQYTDLFDNIIDCIE